MFFDYFLCLLSVLSLTLAFPPFELGFLAYWGLIPFIIMVSRKNPNHAFAWGFFWGVLFGIANMHWFNWAQGYREIFSILGHAVYYAVLAWLLSSIKRMWPAAFLMAVPILWTLLEFIKVHSKVGLPWIVLGYTQRFSAEFVQFSSSRIVFAITFWIVTINVLFIALWNSRDNLSALSVYVFVLILVFLVPLAYHALSIRTRSNSQERVLEVFNNSNQTEFCLVL